MKRQQPEQSLRRMLNDSLTRFSRICLFRLILLTMSITHSIPMQQSTLTMHFTHKPTTLIISLLRFAYVPSFIFPFSFSDSRRYGRCGVQRNAKQHSCHNSTRLCLHNHKNNELPQKKRKKRHSTPALVTVPPVATSVQPENAAAKTSGFLGIKCRQYSL